MLPTTTNINVGDIVTGIDTTILSFIHLAGHNATVNAGTVRLGIQGGATGGNATGTITFDTGVFNATVLQLGVNATGTAPNGASGTFALGTAGQNSTGVLNVTTSFLLGDGTNTSNTVTNAAFLINGGTANINSNITVASTHGTTNSTLTLAGGTLNMNGFAIGGAGAAGSGNASVSTFNEPTSGQTATLANLGGGGVFATGGSGASAGGLSVNGGGMLIVDGANITYTGTTTISSGVLQVGSANSAAAITQPFGVAANSVNNSAVLNFASSKAVTVPNSIGGNGTLTQIGTGATTLLASSNYSGNTTISGGTLAVNGALTASNVNVTGGTLSGTGNIGTTVTVGGGGTLTSGPVPAAASGLLTINNLMVNAGGVLQFDLNNGASNTITVTGTTTLSGGNIGVLLGGPVTSGQIYTVLTDPSGLSQGGFSTAVVNIGRTTFTPSFVGNSLEITVGGGSATLTWNDTGGSPADGTTWDMQTVPPTAGIHQNWHNSGTGLADVFFQGDNVTFNDTTGPSSTSVTVNGQVLPGSVTFANSSKSYTLSGSGGIARGGTGLAHQTAAANR